MQLNRLGAAIVLICMWAGGASAQQSFNGLPQVRFNGPNGYPYGPVNSSIDQVTITQPNNAYAGYALTLSDFASQQDLNSLNSLLAQSTNTVSQLSSATAQLTSAIAQLNTTAEQINASIAAERSRAAQGVAMASAMTIVAPNAGDRFSLTVAGSGFDGAGAGSVTVGYRPTGQIMVFGGYARSTGQNLVKAGVSFSFQ